MFSWQLKEVFLITLRMLLIILIQVIKVQIVECTFEFNHILITMIVFVALKSNHDLKEKYPYVWAGTLKPMLIKDVLTNNQAFCRTQPF